MEDFYEDSLGEYPSLKDFDMYSVEAYHYNPSDGELHIRMPYGTFVFGKHVVYRLDIATLNAPKKFKSVKWECSFSEDKFTSHLTITSADSDGGFIISQVGDKFFILEI